MTADPYVYPDTGVLRNTLDIRDAGALAQAEADITRIQIALLSQRRIDGAYDLKHLQAFHRFIFEGIYDWAGETRTVNITKSQMFCLFAHIASQAGSMFAQMAGDQRLDGQDRGEFIDALAYYLGEVNALHPFREGNGRTQRAFFAQRARDAGYHLAWRRADRDRNDYASQRSLSGDLEPLRGLLGDIAEQLE